MKKIYIAFAVLATALLVSCVKEKSFNNLTPLGENEIGFFLQDRSTKSDAAPSAVKGISFQAGKTRGGESLFVEETIEQLNPGPLTKGTPAYTVNVGNVHEDMLVYAFDQEATYTKMDDAAVEGKGWRYHFAYGFNPWPSDEDADVDFYIAMPAEPDGVTIKKHERVEGSPVIKFEYESPATATDQQDILFAQKTISKATHDSYFNDGGVPVTMFHALTGIKFRMGNELSLNSNGTVNTAKTRTYITKVEFIGIKSAGECTMTFSDSEAPTIEWEDGETGAVSTAESPIYQEFGDDDIIDYSVADNRTLPDSFYGYNSGVGSKDGQDKNLNDKDATMTFWLVPQAIAEDVTVKVTVEIWDGGKRNEPKEVTLDLGAKYKAAGTAATAWGAGQLRTFTIKPQVVDVELTDEMDASKYIKSNVTITNTGNVSEYVRANIVGNWVGKIWVGPGADDYSASETILNGFTTETGNEMTPLWNDKDGLGQTQVTGYGPYPTNGYGTFDPLLPAKASLSGEHYSPETSRHWIRIDKYYYHTTPIGPGDDIDPSAILFDTYTINETPDFWVSDINGNRHKAKDVHLVLDIMVQVIVAPVKTEDPIEYEPYDKAWCDYLGVDMAGLGDL